MQGAVREMRDEVSSMAISSTKSVQFKLTCGVFGFHRISTHDIINSFQVTGLLTYFIATPPDRSWQRNEGLLLLRSFLSLDILVAFSIFRFGTSAKSVSWVVEYSSMSEIFIRNASCLDSFLLMFAECKCCIQYRWTHSHPNLRYRKDVQLRGCGVPFSV